MPKKMLLELLNILFKNLQCTCIKDWFQQADISTLCVTYGVGVRYKFYTRRHTTNSALDTETRKTYVKCNFT